MTSGDQTLFLLRDPCIQICLIKYILLSLYQGTPFVIYNGLCNYIVMSEICTVNIIVMRDFLNFTVVYSPYRFNTNCTHPMGKSSKEEKGGTPQLQ